jgi:hypothetical protein
VRQMQKETTSGIQVKKLVLVNGDEYENVIISNEIPNWIKENVSDRYLAVTSNTFKSTVLIDIEMIVSIQLETNKLNAISFS